MDLDEQVSRRFNDDLGPHVARVAAPAPATEADDLWIIIKGFDGGRHKHGPCLWNPPEGALPDIGEICISMRATGEDGESEVTCVLTFVRGGS